MHLVCRGVLALCPERPLQTEERPTVVRVLVEFVPERFRCLGTDTGMGLDIMRGLLLVEAGFTDRAEKYFEHSDTALGDAMLKWLKATTASTAETSLTGSTEEPESRTKPDGCEDAVITPAP